MNKFYGSCVACTSGKLHYQDVHASSDSSPATYIGECIFFDLQLLPSPSIGGNTQVLTFVDDHSHYLTVLGAKDRDDIMTCILQLIAMYNAQGFTVLKFCTDSEPICLSLATPLGLLHTSITHTTPATRPNVTSRR